MKNMFRLGWWFIKVFGFEKYICVAREFVTRLFFVSQCYLARQYFRSVVMMLDHSECYFVICAYRLLPMSYIVDLPRILMHI